jgi:hypothetical protein
MIIDTYKFLFNKPSLYISINPFLIEKIKSSIITKHKSLRKFNEQKLKINYETLSYEFRIANYHPLARMLRILKFIGLSKNELLKNIKGFRMSGSQRKEATIVPRKIALNKNFIEGYALYLAEGDTGSNGKTRPTKLRFTNSELNVIRFYIQWLTTHFPFFNFYLNIILPPRKRVKKGFIKQISKDLDLKIKQIKLRKGYYNKKIKYRVCHDNAISIYLILSLEKTIKEICKKNKKLAATYIRGMMIGEGTCYFNKSRYVRIEMRNEKEIKYIYKLLKLLGYNCKPSLRSNRKDMWSIYIGAKQLKKFHKEIGFGVHQKRQNILEEAINKKLRINQYV